MILDLLSDIGRNRTGVGLLFGDAKTWQKVNDRLRLHLEFTRELIDADLVYVAHAS
jgi:hypothetical protein